ncbi:hypothetical protein PSTT_14262 [Puccinia striiformis]|uniref:Uncharacterized protein n=1 Tax=Puccinia striiformis TaxID=27350 RepID=A0A2S4UN91_9BASI|nr:hypothetical protein PSTT_14262 [Puccinia striiformis]
MPVWKEDHLAPGQLCNDPVALENYREKIFSWGQRINIKGAIYQDLPPKGDKMTATEIRAQVDNNWAMRICMTYAQLVMDRYYVPKSKKTSQWLEIDKRLGILRAASIEFQKHHAQLVLDKDNKLFAHLKKFSYIPKDDFTVPSLEDVCASMACDEMADN